MRLRRDEVELWLACPASTPGKVKEILEDWLEMDAHTPDWTRAHGVMVLLAVILWFLIGLFLGYKIWGESMP